MKVEDLLFMCGDSIAGGRRYSEIYVKDENGVLTPLKTGMLVVMDKDGDVKDLGEKGR